MERIIVAIITTLIVGAIGVGAKNLVNQGHYWVLAALPVFALWLGWVVGNEDDRDGYRAVGRWIMEKLRLRPRGQ